MEGEMAQAVLSIMLGTPASKARVFPADDYTTASKRHDGQVHAFSGLSPVPTYRRGAWREVWRGLWRIELPPADPNKLYRITSVDAGVLPIVEEGTRVLVRVSEAVQPRHVKLLRGIAALQDAGLELTQLAISRSLRCSPATVSVGLDTLEEVGLVRRTAGRHRKWLISLTPAGLAQAREILRLPS